MVSSEKFCLRWNDFETNISVAFRELREEKDFFDVTLACDDSQVQAHKVILSACSPFFRNVLRRNPHQHPLLYLKGVKYKDILSVLNFMYMGEVNVAQDELNSFLSVAEDLKVKGLTQNNSNSDNSVDKGFSKPEPSKHTVRPREPQEREPVVAPPPPKRPRPPIPAQVTAPTTSYTADDDIQEVVPVKSEPRDPVPNVSMAMPVAPVDPQVYHHTQEQDLVEDHSQGTVALDESYGDESYDYGQYGEGYDDGSGMVAMGGQDGNKGLSELDVKASLEKHMQKLSADSFLCLLCNYQARQSHHITNHIEARHMQSGFSYECDICFKSCPTKNALNAHKSRKHKKNAQF